jgi:hypothetical protein
MDQTINSDIEWFVIQIGMNKHTPKLYVYTSAILIEGYNMNSQNRSPS